MEPFETMQKTEDPLYETEEKLHYLEDSSQTNNLRIKGVEEEEADNKTWDQLQGKGK